MATNSRDARRRRIAERGSDRLALITGRIEALPSSSRSLSDLPPSVVSGDEDKNFSSLSASLDFSAEQFHVDNYGGQTHTDPHILQSNPSSEESRPSALNMEEKTRQAPVSSTIQSPLMSTSSVTYQSENLEPRIQRCFNNISPKQISSAVAASEMTRIYCSLGAALLVFLSYIGFPLLGSNFMKSIILSRPLYLLLVTNISVVIVPLLLDKQRLVNASAEASGASPLGAFQFGRALEVGLMLQHVGGALFMDCSVYSVVVVCLLSLCQKLGW